MADLFDVCSRLCGKPFAKPCKIAAHLTLGLCQPMKAIATSDIDHRVLVALRDDLCPDIELTLDDRSISLKSVEPPSWIQFFADGPWWLKALGAYAALYTAEIVKEGGKETWTERVKIASSAAATGDKILKLAQSIANLRRSLPERSKLVLGLPVPDDYFGVRYELVAREEDLMAAEIALFVQYIPKIERLIEAEGLQSGKVTGAIMLLVCEDLTLKVTWMNRELLSIEERTLHLDNETQPIRSTLLKWK